MGIEAIIKSQYSKVFQQSDWKPFKLMADYYFKTAAFLLKKDIDIDDSLKLMARNIQKRLFLGIGTELLIKSLYLKNGYCINKSLGKQGTKINKPVLLDSINPKEVLNANETFTLNLLIQNLGSLLNTNNWKEIEKGLRIAKVFRNKEGHISVYWHKADPQNYSSIEMSIIEIYRLGFDEKLKFQISFENNEKAQFVIA